jgi:uracil-DNA glycosylase
MMLMIQTSHTRGDAHRNLTETDRPWREYVPYLKPLPHPRCRNNAWFRKQDWFADELVELKRPVGRRLD